MTESTERWDMWTDIGTIVAWLNDHNDLTEHEITLRILKLQEEAGEVAEARINQLAQNPRKGKWATENDVAMELCDVIVTAAVALTTITGGTTVARGFLASKMAGLVKRAEGSRADG